MKIDGDSLISDERLLRQQGAAALLGISRHTLKRIMDRDPTFPRFIELSPGIRMVRAREVRAWLRGKELDAREKTAAAPAATTRAR